MNGIRKVALRAARRRRWRRFVALAGPCLAVAAGAGVVSAIADRLIGPGLAWWHWAAWPIAGGAAVAAALTFLRRQSTLSALVEVDTVLRLHDRLGSAHSLSGSLNGDPFIKMTIEEGERAAARADVARAVPIRWGRSWSAWPVLAGMAAAIGFFIEPMRLLDPRPAPQRIRFNESAAREASDQIRQVVEATGLDEADGASEAEARRRDSLDRLLRELEQGQRPADEALAGAAGVLEEAAEESRTRADESLAASDELRQMLSRIPPDTETNTPAGGAEPSLSRSLRESLREGDLNTAAEALEEIEKQIENLPRAERERLSDELEALSRDLREQSESKQEEAARRRDESRERLHEQGLPPEQSEELTREAEKESLEKKLREQGLSEDAAQRLAEQLAKENRQREAQERAAESARRLSESAKQAAEEVAPPRDEERPNQPGPSDPQREPGETQEPPEQQQQREPGQSQPRRESAEPQQQQEPRERQQQREGVEQQRREGSPQEKPPEEQQPPQREGEQQQQGDPRQSPDQQPPPGVQTPSPSKEQPSEGDPAPQPDQDQERPDGEPAERDNPTSSDSGKPGGMQQMRDALDRMAREQGIGREQQQRAEDLQRQARELLDKASPQEKERLMQWAREQSRESGGGIGRGASNNPDQPGTGIPFRTDEVDVRRTGGNERVAAEWTRPGVSQPDRTISRREFEQQLIEAGEAAQQAMEEQNIPARYKNVQDFYRRALKQKEGEKQPEPAKPPAPAAEDAKKKP